MFEAWITDTIRKLEEPLPGRAAQLAMAPEVLNPGDYLSKKSEKTKRGGVLILFYPDGGTIRIPLMKRTEYPGAHSGQISFPGGKWEEGDQDLIQTALREAEEEIGVSVSDVTIIGTLTEIYINASDFEVLPVVGYSSHKPIFKPDPIEVASIIECDFNELQSQKMETTELLVRDFVKIKTRYYDIQGHTVWGATAMMLSELMTIVSLSSKSN